MTYFDIVPDDIIIHLFNFLSHYELAYMSYVNKELLYLIDNSEFKYKKSWKYDIKERYKNIKSSEDIKINTITCSLKLDTCINFNNLKKYILPKKGKSFLNYNKYCIINHLFKIFTNNSIQIIGCKSIKDCIKTLEYMCNELNISTNNIYKFKINLINYMGTVNDINNIKSILDSKKINYIYDYNFGFTKFKINKSQIVLFNHTNKFIITTKPEELSSGFDIVLS